MSSVVIIDDLDPGFSYSGSWVSYADSLAYSGNYHYANNGNGSSVAQWAVPAEAGDEVDLWITWRKHSNRATNTPVTIFDGLQSVANFILNQEAYPSDEIDGVKWEYLGKFTVGVALSVVMDNNANQIVIADAVRAEIIPGPEDPGGEGMTVAEIARDLAISMMSKTGVQEWTDQQVRTDIANAAVEMAQIIFAGQE